MDKTYGLNWFEVIRRSLACLIFLGLAGFFAVFVASKPITLNGETILSMGLLLILASAGLWFLRDVTTILWQHPRIKLQEDGVTFITRDHQLEWDWDEFTHWSGKMTYHKLYILITTYISGACEFHSDDKPRLSVKGTFKDAPKLARIIILKIMKIQLPKHIEVFQRGETLVFGTLTLNKEGLRYGDIFIPFDDIVSINMNQYSLWVNRKSQPKKPTYLKEDKVRAPELLLAVVNNLVQPPKA